MADKQEQSRLKDFIKKQTGKIKNGRFTCPFCKEVFTGLSALGAHMKEHCT